MHLFHFIIQLTALCSTRPDRLTTSPPLGTKYFGWVCAGPRLLKVKHQTFTSLLISKSYWFDKPQFFNWGKTATIYNSAFAWGTSQLCQCLLIPTITNLSAEEEDKLLDVLKAHRPAIGYSLDDLKGISPALCDRCCDYRAVFVIVSTWINKFMMVLSVGRS